MSVPRENINHMALNGGGFLSRMSGLGIRDVTIVHAEGTDEERRTPTKAHIQAGKGWFEITTPVYEGDVVDLGEDPRGGPDRRLVIEVKVNDTTSGALADMAHIAVKFGKALPPRTAAVRRLTFEALHPAVTAAAGDLFADGHHQAAVAEAFKSIEVRVRSITGMAKSGSALMGDAFKAQAPIIDVATETGQSGQDEREGFLSLFRGSMLGIRNPNAHELFKPADAHEALEYLALASLLHRRIDQASKPSPIKGAS